MENYDDKSTIAHVTRRDKWKTVVFALVCLSISVGSMTFIALLLASN